MRHIVSLSGGVSSAVAADRVINRYGRDAVTLWFADTSWEDEDLYRFIDDCMQRWGGELVRHADGRNPLQIGEEHNIIPNQRLAPCTFELKIEPFERYLWKTVRPITVYLGFNWDEEEDRIDKRRYWRRIPKNGGKPHRPNGYAARFPGVYEDFPLLWKPLVWDTQAEVRSWGIDVPRLYKAGFPHNNCGGRCVKQGIGEWNRLRIQFPERFAEVRDWELAQRAKGGARADYAICRDQSGGQVRPVTLAEIELRNQPEDDRHSQSDMFACFCSY